MNQSPPQGRRNSAGLRRDLELLEALTSAEATAATGLSVTRLAVLTGRDKGQVSRALSTLSEAGFVSRDRTTLLYSLGSRIYDLAARTAEARLVREARPFLRKIMLVTHETAELCVMRGNAVRTLAIAESAYAFRGLAWDGMSVPAWQTATGRALMSDWRDDDLEAWFSLHVSPNISRRSELLPPLSPLSLPVQGPAQHRVFDAGTFVAAIHETRERGFAVDEEEVESGVVGVSAPVYDFHDQTVAALSLSAPKSRLGNHLHNVGAYVAKTATELSELLGHSGSNSLN